MTDREKNFEQLSAYLDGELSEEQARQVESALAGDSELARQFAALRNVRETLRKLPREKAPEDFVARVLAQAERTHLVGPAQQAEKLSFVLRYARFATAAAIALIAASICTYVIVSLYSASQIGKNQTVALHGEKQRSSDGGAGALAKSGAGTLTKWSGGEGGAVDSKILPPGDVSFAMTEGKSAATGANSALVSNTNAVDLMKDGWTVARLSNIKNKSGDLPGEMVASLTINTDQLPQTQDEVERALRANGLSPERVTPEHATRGTHEISKADNSNKAASMLTNNVFTARRLNDEEIVYDINIDNDRAPRVQREISQLRQQREVTQLADDGKKQETAVAGEPSLPAAALPPGLPATAMPAKAAQSKASDYIDNTTVVSGGVLKERDKARGEGYASAEAPAPRRPSSAPAELEASEKLAEGQLARQVQQPKYTISLAAKPTQGKESGGRFGLQGTVTRAPTGPSAPAPGQIATAPLDQVVTNAPSTQPAGGERQISENAIKDRFDVDQNRIGTQQVITQGSGPSAAGPAMQQPSQTQALYSYYQRAQVQNGRNLDLANNTKLTIVLRYAPAATGARNRLGGQNSSQPLGRDGRQSENLNQAGQSQAVLGLTGGASTQPATTGATADSLATLKKRLGELKDTKAQLIAERERLVLTTGTDQSGKDVKEAQSKIPMIDEVLPQLDDAIARQQALIEQLSKTAQTSPAASQPAAQPPANSSPAQK